MKKNYKTPSTNTRKVRTTILCGSGGTVDPTPQSSGSNESVGQGQSFSARERTSGSSLSF